MSSNLSFSSTAVRDRIGDRGMTVIPPAEKTSAITRCATSSRSCSTVTDTSAGGPTGPRPKRPSPRSTSCVTRWAGWRSTSRAAGAGRARRLGCGAYLGALSGPEKGRSGPERGQPGPERGQPGPKTVNKTGGLRFADRFRRGLSVDGIKNGQQNRFAARRPVLLTVFVARHAQNFVKTVRKNQVGAFC